jgi:hypothetical protein
MSALPRKADIAERDHHVRFVPRPDIGDKCGGLSSRIDDVQRFVGEAISD